MRLECWIAGGDTCSRREERGGAASPPSPRTRGSTGPSTAPSRGSPYSHGRYLASYEQTKVTSLLVFHCQHDCFAEELSGDTIEEMSEEEDIESIKKLVSEGLDVGTDGLTDRLVK